MEIVRSDGKGQVSYSLTKPGVVRGNHFHTRKIERFIVIKGKAQIGIRKIGSNKVVIYDIEGEDAGYIDIPVWHTHNIKNVGNTELITLFWISEHFDEENHDTYYEEV